MARKRTPTPEMQTSDRMVINAFAHAVAAIAKRYAANAELVMAGRLLGEFAASKVEVPAKRKVLPRAKPADYADAVANQRQHLEAVGLGSAQ